MFEFIKKEGKCWGKEKAWEWYKSNPRVLGFNYLPTYAVNSTEMWQKESFNLRAIDEELFFAHKYGYNTVRVFMQFILWKEDSIGFKVRLDNFLGILEKYHMKCIVILCDDCAFSNLEPYLGPQNQAIPLVHNSGWTPSPGVQYTDNIDTYGEIRDYIIDVVSTFKNDDRILMWDLYNEPGNNERGSKSLLLLEKVFEWAREAGATQPLTSDIWGIENGSASKDSHLNDIKALELSDIITFHQYGDVLNLKRLIEELERWGYPIICTEWMARVFFDSVIETHLEVFGQYDIGCIHWGLMNGKSQTHIPWEWDVKKGEPEVWFHDVLYQDGTPYEEEEMRKVKQYSKKCIR